MCPGSRHELYPFQSVNFQVLAISVFYCWFLPAPRSFSLGHTNVSIVLQIYHQHPSNSVLWIKRWFCLQKGKKRGRKQPTVKPWSKPRSNPSLVRWRPSKTRWCSSRHCGTIKVVPHLPCSGYRPPTRHVPKKSKKQINRPSRPFPLLRGVGLKERGNARTNARDAVCTGRTNMGSRCSAHFRQRRVVKELPPFPNSCFLRAWKGHAKKSVLPALLPLLLNGPCANSNNGKYVLARRQERTDIIKANFKFPLQTLSLSARSQSTRTERGQSCVA